MRKPTISIASLCSAITISASIVVPTPCLGAEKANITINKSSNLMVKPGAGSKQASSLDKSTTDRKKNAIQHNISNAKSDPAYQKIVQHIYEKSFDELSERETIKKTLTRSAKAEKNYELVKQSAVDEEFMELFPKIEEARKKLDYNEVNRLLKDFRERYNNLRQDHAKLHFLQGQNFELQINYPEAERYYRKAAAIEDENPLYLNAHAIILNTLGRYAEAESPLRRALAIYEQSLGTEHPAVATSLSNLAKLLQYQSKYNEAEPLFRRALAINEKAFGADHPVVASSLRHIANLLEERGKYGQAKQLYRQALAIDVKALGPQHPDVATGLNNVAGVLASQGKYSEAEPLFRRAIGIDEAVFGKGNLKIAISLNNLAIVLEARGKYIEAESLYRQALSLYEKALGPEHPDVAAILNNLALLLHDTGRNGEADTLMRRALAIQEMTLGPYHPSVATSMINLALLMAQDKPEEAVPLVRRALIIMENSLGTQHPTTIKCQNNLNLLLAKKQQ
jgi:tetratricopeptide (TPR) repeat protein